MLLTVIWRANKSRRRRRHDKIEVTKKYTAKLTKSDHKTWKKFVYYLWKGLTSSEKALWMKPSSITLGRRWPFFTVFDSVHIDRITTAFCRRITVSNCSKRPENRISDRLRSFTVRWNTAVIQSIWNESNTNLKLPKTTVCDTVCDGYGGRKHCPRKASGNKQVAHISHSLTFVHFVFLYLTEDVSRCNLIEFLRLIHYTLKDKQFKSFSR